MGKLKIKVGDQVMWKWAGSVAEGRVIEVCDERVEIESAGKRIVRNGSVDNPAIIIKHKNGNEVLKLSSEISQVAK